MINGRKNAFNAYPRMECGDLVWGTLSEEIFQEDVRLGGPTFLLFLSAIIEVCVHEYCDTIW